MQLRMLDYMRKNQSSIIIKVVFAVLTLVMIGFGVQYAGVDGGSAETVAEVNAQPIYRQQLQRAVTRMVNTYRELYRDSFSSELLQGLKFKDQALDDLIRVALLRQEAERLGLEVSNEEVRDAIALIPTFQDNGRFSFDLYDRVLRSNGMTPSDFESLQREDLLVRKVQDLLISGVYVSDDEVKQQFQYDNEQVALSFLQVRSADLAGEVEVSDEQLQKFYDENRERFREPERVRAEIATYAPSVFAAGVTIEEAEVESYYKDNASDFEGKTLDEMRAEIETGMRDAKAVQAARGAARTDHEKAKNGDDIASLAQASGAAYARIGPLARTESVPGAGRVPELLRELFRSDVGQLGDLVETERDTYVVRVSEKMPARLPELAEIRDRVLAEARQELASRKARERAAELLARLRQGEDLKAVAAAANLEVKETEAFRRLDSLIPGLGAQPELRVDAFKVTAPKPVAPDVYDVDGDAVVAVLKEKRPPDESLFEAQKAAIRTQIEERRKRLVVDEYIKEVRARSQIRINPDALDRVYLSRHSGESPRTA